MDFRSGPDPFCGLGEANAKDAEDAREGNGVISVLMLV
jgi:hypothetical protein